MTNPTTAKVNTKTYVFSSESSAREFLEYANALRGVARAGYSVTNNVTNMKRVVVSGHSSMLLDLALRAELEQMYNILLTKENIVRLRSTSKTCLDEADKLEQELSALMADKQ